MVKRKASEANVQKEPPPKKRKSSKTSQSETSSEQLDERRNLTGDALRQKLRNDLLSRRGVKNFCTNVIEDVYSIFS